MNSPSLKDLVSRLEVLVSDINKKKAGIFSNTEITSMLQEAMSLSLQIISMQTTVILTNLEFQAEMVNALSSLSTRLILLEDSQ